MLAILCNAKTHSGRCLQMSMARRRRPLAYAAVLAVSAGLFAPTPTRLGPRRSVVAFAKKAKGMAEIWQGADAVKNLAAETALGEGHT